jgi:hypothetical protein
MGNNYVRAVESWEQWIGSLARYSGSLNLIFLALLFSAKIRRLLGYTALIKVYGLLRLMMRDLLYEAIDSGCFIEHASEQNQKCERIQTCK